MRVGSRNTTKMSRVIEPTLSPRRALVHEQSGMRGVRVCAVAKAGSVAHALAGRLYRRRRRARHESAATERCCCEAA